MPARPQMPETPRALVTGASRGIGRAIAERLMQDGYTVAGVARGAPKDVEFDFLAGDLGDPDVASSLVPHAEKQLGGPIHTAVVAHASLTPMGKIHSVEPGTTRAVLQADVEGTMSLLGGAAQSMMGERWGRIVIISSASAQYGQGKAPLYCASKGALEALAKNLAVDFGRFGVTANVVAPGFIDTDRLRERADDEQRAALAKTASLRRLGTPEDIAAAVSFLCSAEAAFVTGVTLPVTGGAHLANLW